MRSIERSSGLPTVLLFVLVSAAAVFPGMAQAATPDNVHPRMFFYADSLDAVRARCVPAGSPNHQVYLAYKDYVDGLPSSPTGTNYYYMQAFASMYMLSQDTQYADIAIALAMMAVDLNAPKFVSGQGNGLWGCSQLALVYDWCYDRMTQEQIEAIQDAFAGSQITQNPTGGRPYMYLDYAWYYKYVMIHDAPYSADAQTGLNYSLSWLNDCLECADQLMPGGSNDEYYGKYYALKVGLLEVLKHSAGADLISASTHMMNSGRFWSAILRTDEVHRRIPAKYNSSMISKAAFAAWQGSRLGDRRAQAIAKAAVESGEYLGSGGLPILLYYVPSMDSDTSSLDDLNWYDEYGWYFGRTGWNFGPSSSDILTFFHMSPSILEHRGVLHFEIQRGGDDLIPKSAYYEGDTDLHFHPWLNSAVSFNTILIVDPDETFSLGAPNAGQQTIPSNTIAAQKWPDCNWPYGTGYQGEITNIRMEDEYTLIEADASYAYNAAKSSLVLRRWLWIRPSWVLVQDRVALAKNGLPVKTVLHSIHRPEPPEQPEAVKGSWDRGGIFSAPLAVSDPLVIEYGNSSARVYVCQAEASGGFDGAEMRIIGGASRNNQHWRQALQPAGFGYVADPDDASYEFYVESTGGNYMPSDPNRVDESDVAGRFDTPPRVACDWRTEIMVSGAQDTVDIAYLIHVTDRLAPMASVNCRRSGRNLGIRAVAGADTIAIALPPPGTPSGLVYPLDPD